MIFVCLFVLQHRQFGPGRIGQNFFGSGWDLSNLLWEQAGLVSICSRAGGNGQNSFRSRRDWSNVLAGTAGIGQGSFKNRQDWSNFLREWAGLVRISLRAGMIG